MGNPPSAFGQNARTETVIICLTCRKLRNIFLLKPLRRRTEESAMNTQKRYGPAHLAFDALVFAVTVGIWGFILSILILKWVMP